MCATVPKFKVNNFFIFFYKEMCTLLVKYLFFSLKKVAAYRTIQWFPSHTALRSLFSSFFMSTVSFSIVYSLFHFL